MGYRVGQHVTAHAGWAVGVYSYFRDHDVVVESGIIAPAALESSFVHPFSVVLAGNGGIKHVLNDKGDGLVGRGHSHIFICD